MNTIPAATSQRDHRIEQGERLHRSYTDVRIVSLFFWILLLGITWSTAMILIKTQRSGTEARVAASTRELVQTYEAHAVRALREIDQTLRTVKYAYEANDAWNALAQLKTRNLLPPEFLFDVTIADERGTVITSTGPRTAGDVSRQDYFIGARREDAFFIARPKRSGAEDTRLIFSRRLDRADGGFAGVVFISTDAEYFVSSYEPMKLGEHGMLALVGADGIVRARRIGSEVTAGDRLDWAHIVRYADDGSSGGALMVTPWDGIDRFTSARQLGMFPVAVIVGLSRDEQLQAIRASARAHIVIAALVSIVLSIVIAALGRMSRKLHQSRRREQEARVSGARQSGMAEIATNVLHNVGNALNSVNVATTLLADRVRNAKVSGLNRAVALLREHDGRLNAFLTEDPRGKHFAPYLAQLAESLHADQRACAEHLHALRESVEHIRNIVVMQQTFSKASAVREEVDLIEVMEASLQMNADALGRHGVTVVREFEKVPKIVLDKHGVLQILVNLTSNAKHACSASDRDDRQIALRIARQANAIAMSISDNGVGIPPENIARVFNHGFTTRQDGHGFGLHSSALTAKELGGSLQVHSDGLGHGATFTLAIPLQPGRMMS